MIFCDWLELNCRSLNFPLIVKLPEHYDLIDDGHRTSNFNHLVQVTYKQKLICHIKYEPRADFMEKEMILVKFENSLLYSQTYNVDVALHLQNLGLKFHSFTRIDLSFDFNKLQEYHPRDIIISYMNERIIKTDKAKMQLVGTTNKGFIPQYLKFGSNKTGLQYYLYNKSKELKDVKDKPYIRNWWKKLQLNDTDVWRMEFRIQSAFLYTITDIITGESKPLNEFGLELLEMKNLNDLFYLLALKHLDFRIKDENYKNPAKWQRLELFKYRPYALAIMNVPKGDPSTRMNKIFINMLCDEYHTLHKMHDNFQDHEKQALLNMIALNISKYSLQEWAKFNYKIPTEAISKEIDN